MGSVCETAAVRVFDEGGWGGRGGRRTREWCHSPSRASLACGDGDVSMHALVVEHSACAMNARAAAGTQWT